MKKKLIAIVLVVCVLAGAMTMLLSACNDTTCNHIDVNSDGKCDNCGETMPNSGTDTCTHVDDDNDGKCDKCGADMPEDPECINHVDNDSDGKCDVCGADMPAPDGKIHLVFYHTMGASLQTVLNEYLEEFQRLYPQYVVTHKQVGNYDDVRDRISSELMVGTQPNIAYCYPDHVALYNKAKAVQTLDKYIDDLETTITDADGNTTPIGLTQEQKDDFIEGYYNEGKQFGDGLMYTMPFSKSTEVLFYNKTAFEANGWSVPKTWDEMEALCKDMVEKDTAGALSAPLGYDSESNWFITMCEQMHSPYTTAAPEAGGSHFLFNTAENRAFVKRFATWYYEGYVTTQELHGGYTSDMFVNQQSYMCIGSSAGAQHQIPAKVNGAYPFEVGIASIPQVNPDDPKVISQGPSVCLLKSGDAEKDLGSWLLIKYLTTCVEFQADFGLASGYVPVIKSVENDPTYAETIDSADGYAHLTALSAKVCVEQADAYYASPAFYGSSKAREQVGILLQNCMTRSINIDNIDAIVLEEFNSAVQMCEDNIK